MICGDGRGWNCKAADAGRSPGREPARVSFPQISITRLPEVIDLVACGALPYVNISLLEILAH